MIRFRRLLREPCYSIIPQYKTVAEYRQPERRWANEPDHVRPRDRLSNPDPTFKRARGCASVGGGGNDLSAERMARGPGAGGARQGDRPRRRQNPSHRTGAGGMDRRPGRGGAPMIMCGQSPSFKSGRRKECGNYEQAASEEGGVSTSLPSPAPAINLRVRRATGLWFSSRGCPPAMHTRAGQPANIDIGRDKNTYPISRTPTARLISSDGVITQ